MDRGEKRGFGVALAGHVLLFGALSLGLLAARVPKPPLADTMDVTITDKVGVTSAAPTVSREAPAPSEAPEEGAPEEAAPPPPSPVPTPNPVVKPTPPKPEKVEKAESAPEKTEKPEPKPKPEKSKPEKVEKPAKPAPKAAEKPVKSTPARPVKTHTGLTSDLLSDLPSDKPGKGRVNAKPKGSLIGPDILKGLSSDKTGKSNAPRAAAVNAQSMAGLASLLLRQVKPCYNPPAGGTEAGEIATVLSLRMNQDGSVASVTVGGQSGVNGQNQAYARQMADAARRAVMACAPFKLPAELYQGGWEDFDFRFRP